MCYICDTYVTEGLTCGRPGDKRPKLPFRTFVIFKLRSSNCQFFYSEYVIDDTASDSLNTVLYRKKDELFF